MLPSSESSHPTGARMMKPCCTDCSQGQFVYGGSCWHPCHVLSPAERKARQRWRRAWISRADELRRTYGTQS